MSAPDMRPAWRKALRIELARHRAMYQVLTTMASFGNPDGSNVRPSVETLARRAGASQRTVKYALAWARANGWIIQHSKGCRVKHRASFYTLSMGTPGNPPAASNRESIGATVAPIEPEVIAPNAWGNRGNGCTPPLSTTPSVAAPKVAATGSPVVTSGDVPAAEGGTPPHQYEPQQLGPRNHRCAVCAKREDDPNHLPLTA